MFSSRSLRRLPGSGCAATGAAGRPLSWRPHPATVPPAYPAAPAIPTSAAAPRNPRRPTRRRGASSSRFSSRSSLPPSTMLALLVLALAHRDLVHQQRVARAHAVGGDLPRPPLPPHPPRVPHAKPPPS